MNLELVALPALVAAIIAAGAGTHRGPTSRSVATAWRADMAGRPMAWWRRAIMGHTVRRTGVRPRIRPEHVATWCDDVARRIRSGTSLTQALAESVPRDAAVRDATAPIRLAIERGRPVGEAMSALDAPGSSNSGLRHLATACTVIAVSANLGGASAAPLDRVAAALRLRAVDEQERAAHSAQARLSAHVLTVVPVALLCVLAVSDPDVRATIAEPIGAICLTAGLVLNVTGWWWMRHMIGHPR